MVIIGKMKTIKIINHPLSIVDQDQIITMMAAHNLKNYTNSKKQINQDKNKKTEPKEEKNEQQFLKLVNDYIICVVALAKMTRVNNQFKKQIEKLIAKNDREFEILIKGIKQNMLLIEKHIDYRQNNNFLQTNLWLEQEIKKISNFYLLIIKKTCQQQLKNLSLETDQNKYDLFGFWRDVYINHNNIEDSVMIDNNIINEEIKTIIENSVNLIKDESKLADFLQGTISADYDNTLKEFKRMEAWCGEKIFVNQEFSEEYDKLLKDAVQTVEMIIIKNKKENKKNPHARKLSQQLEEIKNNNNLNQEKLTLSKIY